MPEHHTYTMPSWLIMLYIYMPSCQLSCAHALHHVQCVTLHVCPLFRNAKKSHACHMCIVFVSACNTTCCGRCHHSMCTFVLIQTTSMHIDITCTIHAGWEQLNNCMTTKLDYTMSFYYFIGIEYTGIRFKVQMLHNVMIFSCIIYNSTLK